MPFSTFPWGYRRMFWNQSNFGRYKSKKIPRFSWFVVLRIGKEHTPSFLMPELFLIQCSQVGISLAHAGRSGDVISFSCASSVLCQTVRNKADLFSSGSWRRVLTLGIVEPGPRSVCPPLLVCDSRLFPHMLSSYRFCIMIPIASRDFEEGYDVVLATKAWSGELPTLVLCP